MDMQSCICQEAYPRLWTCRVVFAKKHTHGYGDAGLYLPRSIPTAMDMQRQLVFQLHNINLSPRSNVCACRCWTLLCSLAGKACTTLRTSLVQGTSMHAPRLSCGGLGCTRTTVLHGSRHGHTILKPIT